MSNHPARRNPVTANCCPFCDQEAGVNADARFGDYVEIRCEACGAYRLTGTANDLTTHWSLEESKWAAVAYKIRRITDRNEVPRIDSHLLTDIRDSAVLPKPNEALDGVVLWIGQHSPFPGYAEDIRFSTWRSILGAANKGAFYYYLNSLAATGWVTGHIVNVVEGRVMHGVALSPAGWARYDELFSKRGTSRTAFMAMKYGDEQLDRIVRDHFAPAIERCGFELELLYENQGAGLIDDQMRVAIRTSRFVVCDVTHGNRGAYWEAGFAEGLGKPVLYTCRSDVFEDRTHECHPHFDTAHMVTVPWNPSNPEKAGDLLKLKVRATLPEEATLTD